MGLMIKYVDFLNEWHKEEAVDLAVVEEFWAEQVREYFRNQPFVLTAASEKTPKTKSRNAVFVNSSAAPCCCQVVLDYARKFI